MTPLRLQSTDAFIPSISWVICMLHVIIPVEELTCEELEAQRPRLSSASILTVPLSMATYCTVGI